MRLSFTISALKMLGMISEHAFARRLEMSEAAIELMDEKAIEGESLWGISSSWKIMGMQTDDDEAPDRYLVTVSGPRQSLRDWCPAVIMDAADAAHAEGRLLEYDTWEPSWRPSWCKQDAGSLIGDDDLPTEWEDFDSLPIPQVGRRAIPYVRPRLLVGFRK